MLGGTLALGPPEKIWDAAGYGGALFWPTGYSSATTAAVV